MSIREDLEEVEKKINKLENININNSNFDLGNTFKKIIHFLLILILILIATIIFFVIKNNELAKELSYCATETDIMEQDGVYNLIDSKGNMITTDADVLNKYIEEYYGKTEKDN